MSATIFVLGHEPARLDPLRDVPGLQPVNLNEVGLPSRLAGQELAEVRFLLTEAIADCDSEWIGVVSARFEQKWPHWPALRQLPDLAERLPDARAILSPSVWWWPAGDVRRFAWRNDLRYPGLSELLDDPFAPQVTPVSRRGFVPLVYNNTLIGNRALMHRWQTFMQEAVSYYDGRYGLDIPMEVECAWCGARCRDEQGQRTRHPGRLYEPIRHAAYFYEVVSAQFFTGEPIVAYGPDVRPSRPLRRQALLSSAYWRLGVCRRALQRLRGNCGPDFTKAS